MLCNFSEGILIKLRKSKKFLRWYWLILKLYQNWYKLKLYKERQKRKSKCHVISNAHKSRTKYRTKKICLVSLTFLALFVSNWRSNRNWYLAIVNWFFSFFFCCVCFCYICVFNYICYENKKTSFCDKKKVSFLFHDE